jgi:lysophospholipase L1-like esterase
MKESQGMFRLCAIVSMMLLYGIGSAWGQSAGTNSDKFYLQNGDRVVFYGDSITEQRYYTTDVEEYVVTRFPTGQYAFFNAGVGGDRVSGGWAGPVDLRLQKDVFANHPTVVTVMLGMNDGMYRPYDEQIATSYKNGLSYITEQIQSSDPKVRLTLIQPSPHDDVTREPDFVGGYNTVLVKYGEFVSWLGHEKSATVADLNQPVVEVLTKAKKDDAAMSTLLIADRVHPGTAVHWVMAEALLKAWHAPSVVTRVVVEGDKSSVAEQTNTEVSGLRRTSSTISWTQLDRALPLPLPAKELDPGMGTVLADSDLVDALDREDLRVTGLLAGKYELRIDDRVIGAFSAEQFSAGINLALRETPMLQQAGIVAMDTEGRNRIESDYLELTRKTMKDLESEAALKLLAAMQEAAQKQKADAAPVAHRYSVTTMGGNKVGKP